MTPERAALTAILQNVGQALSVRDPARLEEVREWLKDIGRLARIGLEESRERKND